METSNQIHLINVLGVVCFFIVLIVPVTDCFGTLYLRVACYHHSPDLLTHICGRGHGCNQSIGFRLCQQDECYNEQHFRFTRANRLGVCAKRHGRNNFPLNITFDLPVKSGAILLKVSITDESSSVFNVMIMHRIIFHVVPELPTIGSKVPIVEATFRPLNRVKQGNTSKEEMRIDLLGLIRCPEFRYGPYCSIECEPSVKHYCLNNGSLGCNVGWMGPRCEERDHCQPPPCRTWAVCRNTASSFECECDGRIGPQCELKGDPCIADRCANGATCVGIDGRPSCRCPKGWMGRWCDQKDPCESEPCEQRGSCIVRAKRSSEGNTTFYFICKCYEDNYVDHLCRNFSSQSMVQPSTKMTFTILSPVLFTVIIVVCLFLWCRRRKKYRGLRRTVANSIEEHVYQIAHNLPPSVYESAESMYEDPDIYRYPSDNQSDVVESNRSSYMPVSYLEVTSSKGEMDTLKIEKPYSNISTPKSVKSLPS